MKRKEIETNRKRVELLNLSKREQLIPKTKRSHQMDLSKENQKWLEAYESETAELVSDITDNPRTIAELDELHDTLRVDLKNYEGQKGRCSCGALNKKYRKDGSRVCIRGKKGCKDKQSTYYLRFGFTVAPKIRRLRALSAACEKEQSKIEKDAASEEE